MTEYVTRQEAADILNVSLATVDRMIASGDIPVVRLSERAVRIFRSDLHPDAMRARTKGARE